MNSKFLSLNGTDFLKGLLLAVLSPVITIIIQSLNAGSLSFDWKAIATTAASAGLAYLVKNMFTNSAGQFAAQEVQLPIVK